MQWFDIIGPAEQKNFYLSQWEPHAWASRWLKIWMAACIRNDRGARYSYACVRATFSCGVTTPSQTLQQQQLLTLRAQWGNYATARNPLSINPAPDQISRTLQTPLRIPLWWNLLLSSGRAPPAQWQINKSRNKIERYYFRIDRYWCYVDKLLLSHQFYVCPWKRLKALWLSVPRGVKRLLIIWLQLYTLIAITVGFNAKEGKF